MIGNPKSKGFVLYLLFIGMLDQINGYWVLAKSELVRDSFPLVVVGNSVATSQLVDHLKQIT